MLHTVMLYVLKYAWLKSNYKFIEISSIFTLKLVSVLLQKLAILVKVINFAKCQNIGVRRLDFLGYNRKPLFEIKVFSVKV